MEGFPILGGRLLKQKSFGKTNFFASVSNPWREAIEVEEKPVHEPTSKVSNPWREAIEGTKCAGADSL